MAQGGGLEDLKPRIKSADGVINLVLAESALELVPKDLWKAPAVASDARRRGVEPGRILLDRSLHHSAMLRLDEGEKRGRPDLVHVALLSATGTPLYLEGKLKVYVHTCQDMVLDIAERTRIPKSYFRFRGLAEKALAGDAGTDLVKAYRGGIIELVRKRIGSEEVYGLSVQGKMQGLDELARSLLGSSRPCVLVGGFPKGHFSRETISLVKSLVRINANPLEAHVVVSRLVYEIERDEAGFNR